MKAENTEVKSAAAQSEKERRRFGLVYSIIVPLLKLFIPVRCKGKENLPEGPAVFCSNHTHLLDPVIAAAAFGKRFIHFVAKLELRSVPVIGKVLEVCGVCFVNRGTADIGAMRSMMRYLKRGEQVFIFPEGTRTHSDGSVDAKTGAVRIASKLKAPIVPVYIPREKRVFRGLEVVVGEPYMVEGHNHEEYEALADGVMERIMELREGESA